MAIRWPLPGARLWLGALGLLLLSACSTLVPQTMALRSQWPPEAGLRARIPGVPLIAQDTDQCGPAALAMALTHAGHAVSADAVAQHSYLPSRHGSLQAEMLAAPRQYGLVSYLLTPRFADLLREVAAGHPVIVLQDTGLSLFSNWHYAVVVGYDYPAGELILHSGKDAEEFMPFTVFEYAWKKSAYWAMVVVPPDQIPATAEEKLYVEAVLALEHAGQGVAAAIAYRSLLQRWPDDLPAAIALANQAYGQGRLTDAEALLRDSVARHPDSAEALNNLAQVLSDQGRHEEALTTIRHALALDSPFHQEIAATYEQLRQRAQASGQQPATSGVAPAPPP